MGVISSLFNGAFAILIGIFLGFVIAGIIGVIVWGIITLRDKIRYRNDPK